MEDKIIITHSCKEIKMAYAIFSIISWLETYCEIVRPFEVTTSINV